MSRQILNALILLVGITMFVFFFNTTKSFGGMPLACGDPQCDIMANCTGVLCDGCQWCADQVPGDRCIPSDTDCPIFQPLDCGDPQCDIEANCTGGLCSIDCKWCPDALPGDRCVADFVECTIVPTEGPVTIVPTLNEWGIIFASIILGGIGIVVIIRQKNIGKYFD